MQQQSKGKKIVPRQQVYSVQIHSLIKTQKTNGTFAFGVLPNLSQHQIQLWNTSALCE